MGGRWHPGRRGHEATTVLTAYPADLMEAFAVSTTVNRAGRDAPELVDPIAF